tara:strand:- start:85 stop:378 length:294 start_codon:yes stop_codon:yes gene_type:complete
MHWAARRKDGRDWHRAIGAICGNGNAPGRIELEITVHRVRLQDPDNAVASLKPVIDALNRHGWMVDDDCAGVNLVAYQEKCKKADQRTEITWKTMTE